MNVQNNSLDLLEKDQNLSNNDNFEEFKEQMNEWKKLTQQKNVNVFREMTNTIKSVRLEWSQQHEELNKEVTEMGKTIKNLKKILPKQFKNEMQEITNLIN